MRIHAQCRAYICVAHLLLQHWQGDSRFRKFGSKTMSEGVEPDIFMGDTEALEDRMETILHTVVPLAGVYSLVTRE